MLQRYYYVNAIIYGDTFYIRKQIVDKHQSDLLLSLQKRNIGNIFLFSFAWHVNILKCLMHIFMSLALPNGGHSKRKQTHLELSI